ncbi:MAG: hypothetical protein AABX88_00045 [Nanoarchaeota archaeon]
MLEKGVYSNLYVDFLGVSEKISGSRSNEEKLEFLCHFTFICPEVKKFVKDYRFGEPAYVEGFKNYLRSIASRYNGSDEENWYMAQEEVAEKLPRCAIHCPIQYKNI